VCWTAVTEEMCVAGPRTRALFKHPSGVSRAVIVQFKPGWSASLFGVAANAFTDRIVPLADVWGRVGSDLCEELLVTGGLNDFFEHVSDAVALRMRNTIEPASARLARRAVHMLEDGETRVERVAERLGVTARHLRRAFNANVGIGPKDFARALRLQRALRLAEDSSDWVHIAGDAGYCDQAHLINEFRELVGLTPGSYLKRAGDRATPSPCRVQI
jgi:AraC-like DNA-binding protein